MLCDVQIQRALRPAVVKAAAKLGCRSQVFTNPCGNGQGTPFRSSRTSGSSGCEQRQLVVMDCKVNDDSAFTTKSDKTKKQYAIIFVIEPPGSGTNLKAVFIQRFFGDSVE